jgi:hypothetical protein
MKATLRLKLQMEQADAELLHLALQQSTACFNQATPE